MSKSETDVVNAAFYRVRLRRRRGIADKGVDAEPRRPGEMLGWGLWKDKGMTGGRGEIRILKNVLLYKIKFYNLNNTTNTDACQYGRKKSVKINDFFPLF